MPTPDVIWVTEPIHSDALLLLSSSAKVLGPGSIPVERHADVTAILVRAHRIDGVLMESLPNLKVIGKHGAGTDNIDMHAAKQRNLQVLRADGANADSVADLAILFALLLLRSPDLHDRALRAGQDPQFPIPDGFELSERRIGVLGMGAIGRAVTARLIGGFSAKVAGYDPALPQDLWPPGAHRHQNLSDLLRETDLLFLHLPLLPETKGLIGVDELSLLEHGAILVNCARGGIVDEQALVDAMASGRIAGAASDVFKVEPPATDNPLLSGTGRFIGTPHIGASTQAGLRRTGMIIGQKILDALEKLEGKTG